MNESLAKQLHDLVNDFKIITNHGVEATFDHLQDKVKELIENQNQETPNNTQDRK